MPAWLEPGAVIAAVCKQLAAAAGSAAKGRHRGGRCAAPRSTPERPACPARHRQRAAWSSARLWGDLMSRAPFCSRLAAVRCASRWVASIMRRSGAPPWRQGPRGCARKVSDIVGVYLLPPERALVLRVDEKSQIQGLDRSQPMLPMRPGSMRPLRFRIHIGIGQK